MKNLFLLLLLFIGISAANAQTPCSSKSNAPWQEWIARVQFNTIDNASEKARPDKYAVGYSDWKDKTTIVSKGQSYPLSITPGLSYPTYPTNLFTRVWIDYNQNGTFEDTEKVLEKNNGNAPVTQSVTIPAAATSGATTMRVSTKKDAYPTACETFAAGEVEDYSVSIQASATNLPDLTLANLNITTPSVQAGSILSYKFDAKNIGTAAASGNFNIKAYISKDNVLSADDIQD